MRAAKYAAPLLLLAGLLQPVQARYAEHVIYWASGTWVAPSGVNRVLVEVWGGGAGGGGQNLTSDGAGGGGGGAYSRKENIAVTPGNSYTVNVGSGGIGGTGACGQGGGPSWFSAEGTVFSPGGLPGCNSTGVPPAGGLGGTAAAGIGDVRYSGANGGAGNNATGGLGGPGGSSAGSNADADNEPATWATLVSLYAPTEGSYGGDGGGLGVNGANAPAAGFGAGGGGSGDGTPMTGGNGTAGRVIITYYPDLNLSSGDIIFSKASANQYETVRASATIHNLKYSTPERTPEALDLLDDQVIVKYQVDNTMWKSQGFGNGTSFAGGAITAVEIYGYNMGTPANEALTVRITTGTSTLPSVGAQVLASTVATSTATLAAWTRFNFNSPVTLPVLPGSDKYYIVAYNTETSVNGYAWYAKNTDAYANGNAGYSTNQGASWLTQTTDMVFRVYQSSGTEVYFYDGDPDAGGGLIGVSVVAPQAYPAVVVSTVDWTAVGPAGDHNIYVHIDRGLKATEGDEDNNKAFNTITVTIPPDTGPPDAVADLAAAGYSTSDILLNWHATGDDASSGGLYSSTFTIQYTTAAAWAEGNAWSTNTASVPAYVRTTEISTTAVAALSQRYYRQSGLTVETTYYFRLWTKDDEGKYSPLSNGATAYTLPVQLNAPTFVGKGAFASGTGGLTVAVPASYQAGDLFLLFVESANEAIATPAGWTQVVNSPQYTGTAAAIGGVRLAVFYKAASGAEESVAVADTNNHTTAIIANFRGVDPESPVHLSAGGVDAVATASLSAPALTTTMTGTLIVNAIGLDEDAVKTPTLSSETNANLTNLTKQHDETIAGGVGGGIAFITGTKAAAGSTGNTTAAGASTTHAYLTIALKPRVPDLTLASGDITFVPGSADFGQTVAISAVVHNSASSLQEFVSLEKYDTILAGSNWQIDSAQWSSQGFGGGSNLTGAVSAVELYVYNGGSLVTDSLTIDITTGTYAAPSAGAQVLASTTAYTASAAYVWLRFTFNDPVLLPVLPGTDQYYVIAKNWEASSEGYRWLQVPGDVYPNRLQADSDNLGASWTGYSSYDNLFRVSQSSKVEVSYYDGDPDTNGSLIGVSNIAPARYNRTGVSTMTWTAAAPEEGKNIYVYLDRAGKLDEANEANNKAANTILVSSAPDKVSDLAGSGYGKEEISLTWQATGDDGSAGTLNNSAFTLQYTSVTAWAQGLAWSTNTAAVPAYVYTVELATTNVAALSLRRHNQAGLLPNTTYYSRLWTEDDVGRYSLLSNGAAVPTLAEPVTGIQVYAVNLTSVTFNWVRHPLSPSSSTCEGYTLAASTASDFTGIIHSSSAWSVNASTLTLTELVPKTTYYYKVASLNWQLEPNYALAASTCTKSPYPDSPPIDPRVLSVFTSSLTVSWVPSDPENGYLLSASTSSDFSGTVFSSKTVDGTAEGLTVYEPALSSNTVYYVRAGAVWGNTTYYAETLSTSTLAGLVSAAQFQGVFVTSVSVSWLPLPVTPSSSTSEGYVLGASTSSDFTGLVISSLTPSFALSTLTVSGLGPNAAYYFRVGSLNWGAMPNYLLAGSTPTLASPPGQGAPAALAVSSYSVTAQWTSGSPANPAGTDYTLELSSTNFAADTPVHSSTTKILQAEIQGLLANTTYYLKTRAANPGGIYSYSPVIASTSTLAQRVSYGQVFQINITSVTANWLALPASPSSAACAGYVLQASTASDFTGDIFSSSTLNGVSPSTLTVQVLYSDTLYYFRAGSLNWNFSPNYAALGSARTGTAVSLPDLALINTDISFVPASANFGQNVAISATIRNLNQNFPQQVMHSQLVNNDYFYIDAGLSSAQAFVATVDRSLVSVELMMQDYGTTGDSCTVDITTGTLTLPSVGAVVLASTIASYAPPAAPAFVKFTFNDPVRLPVLAAGNAYWIIARSDVPRPNGWGLFTQTSGNPYTPASSADSTSLGLSWTASSYDISFKVNQSSNVEVSYYRGDPDAGGTLIGVSTISAINMNKTAVSTMSCTAAAPEEYRNVYVAVDKDLKLPESDDNNNKAFATIAVSSAPDKVNAISGTPESATALKLAWYATGDDGYLGTLDNASFTIQYSSVAAWAEGNYWSTNTATLPAYVNTVAIATTGVAAGSQRFYAYTGLGINTTYYFRVWTLDDFSRYSPLSAGATVSTLAEIPAVPAEPFGGVYFSSAVVSWLANGNPGHTQYRLQASTAANHTGTLYGPSVGPAGALVATSTSAVALKGCTTFYFWVQALNGGGVATEYQLLGSTRTVTYFDAGLRVFDGTQNVLIACQPTYCDTVPPLRIHKGGVNYAIGLVDAEDPKASKLKVKTATGIKYWRKY